MLWTTPLLLLASAACLASAQAPTGLRVDLHLSHAGLSHGLFVSLDPTYPLSQNGTASPLLLSWALPPALPTQASARVLLTSPTSPTANATVYDSGWVASASQRLQLSRALLQPAREYAWTVAVRGPGGQPSSWAQPQHFFTSAGPATWAASAPVWPASCAGGAPPSFARLHAELALRTPPAASGVLSALLYITGSPPIYSDPWNVTKILGGYKLALNGSTLGVGPGRTSCGPVVPGAHQQLAGSSSGGLAPCTPIQPVDGYDVSAAVRAALAAGLPLPLDIASYGLSQQEYGLVAAVQAALHIRWWPEGAAPDTVLGTAPAPPWLALDADSLYNPGSSKAPFWYTQPREDVNVSCLPPLPSADSSSSSSGSLCNACGWALPAPVPSAWLHGTVPLAGKTTQALSYSHAPPLPSAQAQLGPGWYTEDAGVELQGGLRVRLLPGAPLPPQGASLTVQLGSEMAVNGSVLWRTRAGNRYQDTWSFPGSAALRPEQAAVEHHEFCEFRYAEVIWSAQGSGAPLALLPGVHFLVDFWVVRYPYDSQGAARLATSSPQLDAVFGLAASTLRTTTLDFYADSNTRQRSIDCMADDTTAALNQYATTTELALPRMTAAQIMGMGGGSAQGPLGYISSNWCDWTILPGLNIYYDALFTGDLSLAALYYDVLVANHTYAYLIDPTTALVHNGPALSALIDTSGGSDDGYQQSSVNSVVNAWVHLALRCLARLGRWLGRGSTAAALDALATAQAAAFQAAMYNASAGGGVCDGLCSATPHTAAHATFYALMSGILDGAPYQPALVAWLQARTASNGGLGMPCGAYPAQFLLGGLYAADSDHGAAAYAVLTSAAPHSWLHMMGALGATATMECWLPEELPNLSFSHVWSSSPAFTVPWLLFGLTPTAPGYAAFDVKPQPGPVLQGRAVLPSAAGPIAVSFEQRGEAPGTPASTMALGVTVPGGCSARALLPLWGCAAGMQVTLDGAPVAWAQVGDYAAVQLGPGEHALETAPCPKR